MCPGRKGYLVSSWEYFCYEIIYVDRHCILYILHVYTHLYVHINILCVYIYIYVYIIGIDKFVVKGDNVGGNVTSPATG